eukprot:CAMPEP_0171905094 /NCGR_PEP_ID=MMETSP0993-20121228/4870_1 /TAXON_ID=483369 /ORGANISM="non described non described, Strain CCMP2098" /LENGTH=65 /DNA_ID=CAMNT_0012536419 /DNA_START=161 /DNA_END=355 /DNA_ORIENTATION=+
MTASCLTFPDTQACTSAISQKVMRIDSSDWLKLAALTNEDSAKTPLLIDLPQKLNCDLDDFLKVS